MEGKRLAIIDKDGINLLDIVESTTTPGVFGIVALNPDGTPVSGGGGGTWGSITGILSDQTDLQDALNLKANLVSPTFTGTVTVPTPTNGTDAVTKAYADGLVVGLLDDRGSYDASVNTFPASGGSGTAGAILKGDLWYISVAGTLGGVTVNIGDSVRSLIDTPGQTATNWSVLESNIGYVPANDANTVHKTGPESIGGIKTFTDVMNLLAASGTILTVAPTGLAAASNAYITFNSARATIGWDGTLGALKLEASGAKHIVFNTNGSLERMRITDTGIVGIGTNNPTTGFNLDVFGGALLGGSYFNNATGTTLNGYYSTGTYSTIHATNNSGTLVYPYSENGNLVIQPRCLTGGSERDIVFITGSVPTSTAFIRMVVKRTGNVLIGGITDVASAILNVDSTTKGFLPPRMTTIQRDAISTPAAGLHVENITTNTYQRYNGSAWVDVGGGGSFAWGASVSPGSGVGITLTTTDLAGAFAFQSSTHTASGTLTACTTTQNTYATSRTYTLTSGSVTDNFIGTLFSRTNVTTGAGGTLLAQGPVVKITGTDTQTAGTLTPSYDLLALAPSLRSTGSSLRVTVANSVVTAPTNGHIYAVLDNTQSVSGQILMKLNIGTSSSQKAINLPILGSGQVGMQIDLGTASTATSFGIYIPITNRNVSNQRHSGIQITNDSTGFDIRTNGGIGNTTGSSIELFQVGAGGTSFHVYGQSNVNSSTNGLVNYTLSNTQSGATVIQKINMGSSAQAHVGISVVGTNASATANAFEAKMGTGYTGDYFHASLNSVDTFRVSSTGAIISAESITTGTPNTGTAAAWKLGSLVTGQVGLVIVTTQYVEIDIGGTLYKLATV